MKSALLSLTLVVVLASCTTAYKAAQTPDDVYYSPARPHAANDEYLSRNDRNDQYRNDQYRNDQYRNDEQNEDDRYLRMKVRNRRTWSDLDYYYSDPYAYNYYSPFNTYGSIYTNTPWNYYSSWNYYYNPYSVYHNNYYNPYYNPYGSKVVIINQRPPVVNRPRMFNLNTYYPPARSNNAYNNHPNGSRRVYYGDNRNYNYNNQNSNNNSGSSLRNIFSNSNNNSSNNSYSRPSSSSSAPSSSPSRSSGNTNAPVRKF